MSRQTFLGQAKENPYKHLIGKSVTEFDNIALTRTDDKRVDWYDFADGSSYVLIVQPGMSTKQEAGEICQEYKDTPGAVGCGGEGEGFKDLHETFKKLGYTIYTVSSKSSAQQKLVIKEKELPFAQLSDFNFRLAEASSLKLPTFEVNDKRYYQRAALIIIDRKISHVIYGVDLPKNTGRKVLDELELLQAQKAADAPAVAAAAAAPGTRL